MTTSPETSELYIVTGASTSMGAATARELASQGHFVLAGVRREEDGQALASSHIRPVILDITRPEQIAELVDIVETDGRPLRTVINNAGIAVNAPVEVLPMAEWRRQFDVNFFGHIEVTQALLPSLLRSRGRVVMMSSIGGRLAQPTYGAYSGSKFASGMTVSQERRYGGLMQAIIAQSEGFLRDGVDSSVAAKTIVKAATASRPKTRYTIGRDAALLTRLARIMPDRILDRVLASALRPHYPSSN